MPQLSLVEINTHGDIVISEGQCGNFEVTPSHVEGSQGSLPNKGKGKVFTESSYNGDGSYLPQVIQLMDESIMCKNLGTPMKSSFKLDKKILRNMSVHDILKENE